METDSYKIYAITSADYWYVGSSCGATSTPEKRFKMHMSGYGNAPLLAAAVDLFGSEIFHQEILEASVGDVIEAEQWWYDHYLLFDSRDCLNKRRPWDWSQSNKGKKFTPEHCAKIGAASAGRKHTPATRAKISAAQKGGTRKSPDDETKSKISTSLQGHLVTDTAKLKMSIAHIQRGTMPPMDQVECECGLITTRGPLSGHMKSKGHQVRVNVQ